jgi:predicted peroxiredoxin
MGGKTLIVKVTVGQESAERCAQGFTVAATALASGVEVILWLTGDATEFALPGQAEKFTLEHSAALSELRNQILDLGKIKVCTQCAKRRGITEEQLLPGIEISGASSFVADILGTEVQALVY